jgi:methionyl-tRNA formyltransferase
VATANLAGTDFKIHTTRVLDVRTDAAPGTILALTKKGLQVACGQGAVEILQLQAQGGKRMAAPDYFRGHPLEI